MGTGPLGPHGIQIGSGMYFLKANLKSKLCNVRRLELVLMIERRPQLAMLRRLPQQALERGGMVLIGFIMRAYSCTARGLNITYGLVMRAREPVAEKE